MIALFGGFEVRRGAYTIDEASWGPRRKAAQRLVRFLIVHREHRVPEDHLFAAFWPEKPADAARRSLQVTVSSARAVLDPDGSERSMLESADRGYRLVLGPRDAVDTDGFERAALAALGTAGSGRDDELEAAAARWGGEPLSEDRYEDWAAPRREQLHDLHGRLLGALADARSEAGDLAGAVEASREQVGLDPLDEDAHRRLMLAYARSGRRGHALRQFLAAAVPWSTSSASSRRGDGGAPAPDPRRRAPLRRGPPDAVSAL